MRTGGGARGSGEAKADGRPSVGGRRSLVIGLTGGVASGKSLVAETLESLGARRVNADAIVDELYAAAEVRDEVRRAFGEGVFRPDGSVDRRALGGIVFADRKALKQLTDILHSRTRPRIRAAVEEARAAGAVLVLDVPLLRESGLADLCDLVLFVDAPLPAREARGRARGWPEGEVERRERFQAPLEEKRRAAHAVIESGGRPEETRESVRRWWVEHIHPV